MANVTTSTVEQEIKNGRSVAEIARKYRLTRQAIYWHVDKINKKEKFKNKAKPKRNYNLLIDWKVYNEGLVKRGEFLLDIEGFEHWREELKRSNQGKQGRPYQYPDSFILFFLRLKSVFKTDYRTLEGISRKMIAFIPQARKAPDYTTFCIRLSELESRMEVYQKTGSQDIAGDSSGLKTSNRGEYRLSKYRGQRRKFVKLHLAVNIKTKQVVWYKVTKEQRSDTQQLPSMIRHSSHYGKIDKGYFDAGYDSKNNYQALKEKGIVPVIRPKHTTNLEHAREMIRELEKNGKDDVRLHVLEEFLLDEEKWKEKYDYGKRWAVEDRYSVFKRLFSEHVWSKKMKNIKPEVSIKLNLMNLFTHFLIGSKKEEAATQIKVKEIYPVNPA